MKTENPFTAVREPLLRIIMIEVLRIALDDQNSWFTTLELINEIDKSGKLLGHIHVAVARLRRAGWLEDEWAPSIHVYPKRRHYRLTTLGIVDGRAELLIQSRQ